MVELCYFIWVSAKSGFIWIEWIPFDSNEPIDTVESETTGIDERPSGKKAYILVHLDKIMLRHFVRSNQRYQTDFKHRTNVYLPIRYKGWLPELPSQDYFFAEGKVNINAQAEYAEYRFKDGILLLARLLIRV